MELTKEDLLRILYSDPPRWMRTVLPDWFPSKMPWVHRGIIAMVLQRTDFLMNFGEEEWPEERSSWTQEDLIELAENFTYKLEPDNKESPTIQLFELEWSGDEIVAVHLTTSRFLEVMLPRGFSKTTLFNALILFMVAHVEVQFITYASETQSHANLQLGNVKRVMETNAVFRELYGNLVPERNDPAKWVEDFVEPKNGVWIRARGRGGQIRGSNIDAKRPDLILIDDVEDPESVKTPEQRNKTMSWMMSDVMPALPRHRGRIFVLGTMLHEEAMMPRLARDPQWVMVRFGAKLDNGRMAWPWYMKEDQWEKIRTSYQRQGMLGAFYMEYQSTLYVDAENRKFRPDEWRVEVMARTDFTATAIAVDPAISDKADADNCTFAVVGMTDRGRLHVLDLYGQKGMHPRDQINKYFELNFRWDCTFHGIEAIAYQRALVHLVQEEMARMSRTYGPKAYHHVTPLKHGTQGKIERVEGILVPRYAAGYITHQRRFDALLLEALDWPHGKKDHLDVVAMAVSLLDPVAALAAPPLEQVLDLKPHEYQSLWADIQDAGRTCP